MLAFIIAIILLASADCHFSTSEANQNSNSESCVAHVFAQCISSHVLSGLCKVGGYEILRHGTSWTHYKSILETGADPRRGGKTTEESEGRYVTVYSGKTATKVLRTEPNPKIANARNKFYVFRDSKAGITQEGTQITSRVCTFFGKRLGPIRYSCLAYMAEYIKADVDGEERAWMKTAAYVKAVFTPKLKFIYSLEEIEGSAGKEGLFENDPDYEEAETAYRTSHALPSDRIGLKGFITYVNGEHVWTHIQDNPCKFLLGTIQLIMGIVLSAIPSLGYMT